MIPVQELHSSQHVPDFMTVETQSLQIRTDLMLGIQLYIQQQGWTPEQAASALRQTLPLMQNLMNGEISRFSVEQLVQLLNLAGLQVRISIKE
ncbi:MAG: XRE family transcriptional regulator [Cyanobacteria bacterium J06636_16]